MDILVIAGAFVAMLALTWQKWVDPAVDFGQQLEISREVSLGSVLYRDVTSFHGPLSPYLQAALFLVFGPSIRTIVAFNLLIVAVLALVLFRLLTEAAGRFAATGSTLLFLVVFAFGQYTPASTYNYVAPYTAEIEHGLLLGLLAVLFTARTAQSGRAPDAFLAGLSAGLCFLTKAETFVAALGAAAAGLGAVVLARRRRGESWMHLAAAFQGGLLLPAGAAFLLFRTALSPGGALLAAAGPWPAVLSGKAADLVLYRWVAGTVDVAGGLASVAVWLALLGGTFALAALWARRIRPREVSIGFALAFGLAGLLLATTWRSPLWFEAARPLPVLLAAGAAWILLGPGGLLRGGSPNARDGTRLSLAVFALLLLLKTPLAARVYHYGQFLSMPGFLLVAAALLGPAADAVGAAGGNARHFRAVVAGAFGLFAAVALARTLAMGTTRGCAFGEGPNAFLADERGCLIEQVRKDLVARAKPGQTLAVLPEGALLNFVTGLRKPTRFTTLMPTEFEVWGEDAITVEFQKHPPDWVVLVHKETAEFGARFFGRDYLARLGAFVAEGYEPVSRWGDEPFSDRGFGVKLLKRKSGFPRGGPPGTSP